MKGRRELPWGLLIMKNAACRAACPCLCPGRGTAQSFIAIYKNKKEVLSKSRSKGYIACPGMAELFIQTAFRMPPGP